MNRLPSILLGALVAAVVLASPIPAFAQASAPAQTSASAAAPPDNGSLARIHWGPVALDPKFQINNIGVDSNVFNTPTPTKDFNISLAPRLDEWTRIGRLYLSGQTTVGLTYYKKAKSQRSVDFGQSGRADFYTLRVTPHVSASYLNSNQRLNAEFDDRVPHNLVGFAGGFLLPIGVRLSLDLEATRSTLTIKGLSDGDFRLAGLFNRESRGVRARFNIVHSPLTTFVVRGELQQDRFETAVERDSNSVSLVPGVEFTRDALFAGNAYVGYRAFMTRNAAVPDFSGLVADVGLRVAPRELTKIAFRVSRAIDYSVDEATPFFVSTGGDVTVSQGIGGAWDLVGRLGVTRMSYHGRADLVDINPFAADRTDTVRLVGTGIGRTLTNGIRLGFDFDHVRRNSVLAERQYSGFRAGGSVSYGF